MQRFLQLILPWRRAREGAIHILQGIESPQLGNSRDILVYTPGSYARGRTRYPVIYMHDGQNLFDPKTSFAGDWGLKSALARASRRGIETIVVAIPNMGKDRIDEYTPFADQQAGGGHGTRYLDFLIDTVKPLVDERFRTLSDRAHTGIAGSSLGGLISLYAYLDRPDVFGFAAALSPALWFGDGAILELAERAPRLPGRIYLDVGLREGARHVALARRLRDTFLAKGYTLEREFRFVEDRDGKHHESAWGRRFRKALPFLLKNGGGPA
jgi:predicted alpha/beta superfamily hydrolase